MKRLVLHRLTLCLLSLALTMIHSSNQAADDSQPAATLLAVNHPLVIGHRGYARIAPENTMLSFKLALDAGADLVELDYHHSADGHLVVIHDFTLDRTTDAINRWGGQKLGVDTKNLAELKTLDAGSWFNPSYAGTRLPSLEEALDFTHQRGGVTLIERKAGDAAACVRLLREKKLINQVVVQAFDWSYLKSFHELEPEQILGALGPPKTMPDGGKPPEADKTLNAQWLDSLQPTGVKVVVWNDQITASAVRLVHERGLKVWIYTINDPAVANRLLDLGVDGLITDDTSLMRNTVAARQAN